MGELVHLHNHTCYSINDGLSKIDELVKRAKELGMKALAVTEHGNMFSAVYFYKACKKAGIKPIIGCEIYIHPTSKKKLERDNRHLVLLAENEVGYRNLVKIVSDANMEGFYYNPRTDMEFLRTHSEGLIALSACVGGDIAKEYNNHIEHNTFPFGDMTEEETAKLHRDAYKKALKRVKEYIKVFGKDNYFLEVQNNELPEQYEWNEVVYKLAEETGLRVVCTNDTHYVYKNQAKDHDGLMAIQAGVPISNPNRKRYGSDEFYLKSFDELNNGKVPVESLTITQEIADRCNFDFEFGEYHIPVYDTPEGFNNTDDFLDHLIDKGLYERYGERAYSSEIQERKDFEISVIRKMGFNDYFLITWDFVNYCKVNDIPVGPGRGSAAGSIISYAIGITDVDPIRFNLLFFRFLNPDRIGMPDIDIDFSRKQRYKVIEYVKQKYGTHRVANIITYLNNKAKAAVRNAGRALDMPNRLVDQVAKAIPDKPLNITLKEAMEISVELYSMYQTDTNVKQIIDLAMAIEGNPHATGQHAAGIVIAPTRIDDYVPVVRSKDGEPVAAYDMTTLEELGLLKCDFLGLRNLDIIDDAVKLIEKNRGIKITNKDLINLIDDPNSYKLMAEGKTLGIFQTESDGMASYAKQMKIATIDEAAALLALYRPGPMDSIPDYINNKMYHKDDFEVPFEPLRPILKDTYGILVYQEQVMLASIDLAGYTGAMSDYLRKAIGKKKEDLIAEHKNHFIYGNLDNEDNPNKRVCGAIANGHDENRLIRFYDDDIVPFGKYSFNKSHAVCYAFITAQTGGLKYYYPEEYMAALLSSVSGIQAKVFTYTEAAKELGIEVLLPDINSSYGEYTVDNGNVRMGLNTIKNVGSVAVEDIVREREANGHYTCLRDFINRTTLRGDVSIKDIEWLIKSGTFSSFGHNKSSMVAEALDIKEFCKKQRDKIVKNRIVSIFDNAYYDMDMLPNLKEYPSDVLLKVEKMALGVYMSGHPLDEFKSIIKKRCNMTTEDFQPIQSTEDYQDDIEKEVEYKITHGQQVKMVGIISTKRVIRDKNNQEMAFLSIEDMYGSVDVTIFASLYSEYRDLKEDDIIYVFGKVSHNSDFPPSVLANRIDKLEKIKITRNFIKVNSQLDLLKLKKCLNRIALNCKGEEPLYLEFSETIALLGKDLWVNEQGLRALNQKGFEINTIKD